jgi:hypothetical protein
LTKIINYTNKETDLKAPHPVIYGGVLNNLSQIFSDTQRAKMTGFLPLLVSFMILVNISIRGKIPSDYK